MILLEWALLAIMYQNHQNVPGSMAVVVEAIMLAEDLHESVSARFVNHDAIVDSRCDIPAS